jgi:hypothetical protein
VAVWHKAAPTGSQRKTSDVQPVDFNELAIGDLSLK